MVSQIRNGSCRNIFTGCFVISPVIFTIIQIIVIASSTTCLASSDVDKKYYKGAVVEYAPDRWNQIEHPQELLLRNARRYITIIQEASKEKTDIIVFPEAGLITLEVPVDRKRMMEFAVFVPPVSDEDEKPVCHQSSNEISQTLQELSCAALDFSIYVVLNLWEKLKCNIEEVGCPSDGLLLYNTNIVFDRKGKIIAKYRKFNLFVEPETNVTSSVELVTFDTDFGVRFGMFICFDLLFYEPAIKILEETGVKNIVYSTAWFSELPHLTAVEAQSGYSYSQNINLLASGYCKPEAYNGGSGIFSGERGPLVMIMPEESTTKLLIAKIPVNPRHHLKNPLCSESDQLYCEMLSSKIIDFGHFDKLNELFYKKENEIYKFNFYHEDLSKFTTEALNKQSFNDKDTGEKNLKESTFFYNENGFRCEINVKWKREKQSEESEGPFYRFVAYSGERSYVGIRTVKIEVCSLIACKDEEFSSCGYRPNFYNSSLISISSIDIYTQSIDNSNPYVVTLNKYILPLSGDEISFHKSVENFNDQTLIKSELFLEKPQNDLISFGIYKT